MVGPHVARKQFLVRQKQRRLPLQQHDEVHRRWHAYMFSGRFSEVLLQVTGTSQDIHGPA
jgi:hypothetical protein